MVVKPIMLWLDPFLRHTLTDLFVWPNRIVVPLSPDPNFDYSILEMRCALKLSSRDCCWRCTAVGCSATSTHTAAAL